MASINDWKKKSAGTIKIDLSAVEENLGFKLHENIKDLYSRVPGGNNRRGNISGIMTFAPEDFVKEYVNKDNWLENANGYSNHAEFTLFPLQQTDNDYVCEFFQESFSGDWTGGNDFGHRAYIGEININIGQISLIFNNDTGRFEWADFGYGYFENYEDNPYGIIADTAQEFLDKFNIDEDLTRKLSEPAD